MKQLMKNLSDFEDVYTEDEIKKIHWNPRLHTAIWKD